MAKVVRPGTMFFEDDIKIIDAELDSPLSLSGPMPIFSRDEVQLLYKGHIFVATGEALDNNGGTKLPEDYLKSYTLVFGVREIENPKVQEDAYFLKYHDQIEKVKEGFIERVVNGLSELDASGSSRTKSSQIGQELADRIIQRYATLPKQPQQPLVDSGLIGKLDDGSVFNSEVTGCERVLLLDRKVYELFTMQEYVAIFENSFDATFYQVLLNKCKTATPEEISQILTENRKKVHRKVFPRVRNKIWHSERSGKLYLDGTFWLPVYRGKVEDVDGYYKKMLERKIKIDAARGIK